MSDQAGSGGAWHPDPLHRYSQRWWDGNEWTDQVIDATGETITDPMGVTAAPAVDATIVDPIAEPGTTSVVGAPPPPGGTAVPPMPGAGVPPMPGSMGGGTPVSTGGPPLGASMATTGAKQTNGLAIAALVMGILGVFCLPPLALGAVLCGVLGLGAVKRVGTGKGMSIAGLVLGVVAIIGWLVFAVSIIFLGSNAVDDLEVNTDPSDGICNPDRWLQDPDCGSSSSDF